ncbi:hypothetical protein [Streptomyces sp. SudanB91_2054]|uniref:hypothetical protein n=1 Tax=Streptomyces sp. SudanB91_2054 TaxID=3035278 RepID=UPI0036D7FEF2
MTATGDARRAPVPPGGRREDRRAQLVEAAVDHVAAHGIADLSLRRLVPRQA